MSTLYDLSTMTRRPVTAADLNGATKAIPLDTIGIAVQVILTLAALTAFTVAAFVLHLAAGWAVGGLMALIAENRVERIRSTRQ